MDDNHKDEAVEVAYSSTEDKSVKENFKKIQHQNAALKVACQVLLFAVFVISALFIWQVSKRPQKEVSAPEGQIEMLQENEMGQYECPILPQSLPLPVLPQNVHYALMKLEQNINSAVLKLPRSMLSMNVFYRDRVIWSAHHAAKHKFYSWKPDDNTIYRVGSLSKILVALMVFKFVEDGWIRCLDDPLEMYIPQFSVRNPFNKHKITIRHILSHTSGLPREPPCGSHWSTNDTYICPVTTETVLHEVSKMTLKFPPGTNVAYSNLGYSLLGRTLSELFTRTSYEVWVKAKILKPLGMLRSGYDLKSSTPSRARAFGIDGKELKLLDWGWAAPAFQLHSTLADLTKLMKMFLQKSERFLKSETTLKMFKEEFTYPDSITTFGSPWEITRMNYYRVFSKTGYVPGYSAVTVLVPDLQLGVNVMMTGQPLAPRLADFSLRLLIPAFKVSLKKLQTEPKAPSNAGMFTGTYYLQSQWVTSSTYHVNISLKHDVLRFSQSEGTPKTAYLRVLESLVLQLVYPSGLSCQHYGLLQNYETLIFEFPNSQGLFEKFDFGPFVFTRREG